MGLSNITITAIDSFAYIPLKKSKRYTGINRLSTGLVFCPNGINVYYQKDEKYMCDNNHVILLPEGADYVVAPEEDIECYVINFRCYQRINEIRSFNVADSNIFLDKFEKFSRLVFSEENDSYFAAMSYLYGILDELNKQNPTESAKTPEFIQRAAKYIQRNLSDTTLDIKAIAKNAGVSSVHFRKTFRDCYGISPMHYVGNLRIKKAQALLRTGEISVEQVALSCGFSSVYSFSRAFKAVTGKSPTQYRQN